MRVVHVRAGELAEEAWVYAWLRVEDESDAKKIIRLMEDLEDNDDVQEVFANFDIPERVLESVAG